MKYFLIRASGLSGKLLGMDIQGTTILEAREAAVGVNSSHHTNKSKSRGNNNMDMKISNESKDRKDKILTAIKELMGRIRSNIIKEAGIGGLPTAMLKETNTLFTLQVTSIITNRKPKNSLDKMESLAQDREPLAKTHSLY